jgi:pSer/pThr/pTyr-binding forkhead associated (FHA) protein
MSQQPTDLFAASCGATVPLELNVSGPGLAGTERRTFEHPFVLIGRHETNCLRLDDAEVSRRHVYLQQLGGRVFCVDLGSRTGIRWEGEPRPAGWLRPDERIQIGPFTLELAAATPAGAGPVDFAAKLGDPLQDRMSAPLPQLTVELGNEVKSRLQLNRVLVLVGSSPECRVRLRDAGISRHHCSLVTTPEGVWVIDLLSGNGTRLNGQPTRWALVKDGDQLQVGPYTFRVSHPAVSAETPRHDLSEIPAGTPGSPAAEIPALTPELQAELDAARERQRDAEVLRQQLADSRAECERLREQARALGARADEAARLQVQLEAAEARASELDAVRAERDRWQAETRDLRSKLAADLQAARMEQDRLQAEQQESRHSAEQAWSCVSELERTLMEMTDGHKTALEEARAHSDSERQELEARFAQERQAHAGAMEAAVGGVQAQVSELERSLTEAAEGHKTTLEEARARWETERQELEARLEQERQSYAGTTEAAARDSQARLSELERSLTETAEAHKTALEEARARWEAERQELEACLTRERQYQAGAIEAAVNEALARASELEHSLAEAAEDRKKTLEEARAGWESEREELKARLEQERRAHAGAIESAAGEVQARVSELERTLRETAEGHKTTLEEARARWEAERQELEARLVQERQTRAGEAATGRDSQARISELERTLTESIKAQKMALEEASARWEAEREEWRQRLEGAELQLVWERKMFQEWGEQVRQQAAFLQAERNRVAARLAQVESFLPAEQRSPAEAPPAVGLEHLRQQAAREEVFAEISRGRSGPPRQTDLPRQPTRAEGKAGEEPPR